MPVQVELSGGPFSGAVLPIGSEVQIRIGLPDFVHTIVWEDQSHRSHESPGLAVYDRTAAVSPAGRPIFRYAEPEVRDRTPWLKPDQIVILAVSELPLISHRAFFGGLENV